MQLFGAVSLTTIPPFPSGTPVGHTIGLVDPARLDALRATGLMDSLPEQAFDRVVRLASQVTGVPVGLFSLVDGRRQFFKAKTGLTGADARIEGTPLSSSFCQYVVTSDSPLAVGDARAHPLLSENGAVAGLGVIAYLGTPIHAPGGQVIGSLCAIDTSPRDWTEAQLAALRDLAAIIETELALRNSMAERALISTELNHRIKNLFTIVSSMVRLSSRHHEDAGGMAADLEARVNALARAHQLIVPGMLADPADRGGSGLEQLLKTLLAPYLADGQQGRVRFQGPAVVLGGQAATSLALAFHELATNSAKYGALGKDEARLDLDWHHRDGQLHLHWNELSAPASAPVSSNGASGGFGSQLLELTIEGQLRGRIETNPAAAGLRHAITIPVEALAQ